MMAGLVLTFLAKINLFSFFYICTSAAAMIKPSVSGGSVTVTAMVQGGEAVVGMVKEGTRGGGGRAKATCLEMKVDAYLCCVLLHISSRVPDHHRQRRRCSRIPAARSQSRATWQERSVFGKRDVLVWPSRTQGIEPEYRPRPRRRNWDAALCLLFVLCTVK
jgi:hypothetical protein